MVPFQLHTVRTEGDAFAAAATGGRYIAGGTTLVDLMREEVERPAHLVDINRLPLTAVRDNAADLTIGALARMAEVAAHPAARTRQPLIVEALLEGASPQLRNRASIGGNLLQRVRCPYFRMLDAPCNKRSPGTGCSAIDGLNGGHAIFGTSEHCVATHPSDLAVALTALDAAVTVRGPQGEREFPVEQLYRLPEDTPHLEHTLRPGELIVSVRVPHAAYARRARYLKIRDRASYEFAIVSVAAALELDGDRIRAVRLAAGGVGTLPWRLRASESALVGSTANRAAFNVAAEAAVQGAKPLAHNAYKIELLRRTLVRTLEMARDVT